VQSPHQSTSTCANPSNSAVFDSAGIPAGDLCVVVGYATSPRLSAPSVPLRYLYPFDFQLSTVNSPETWPLRCSLTAVLVFSKRRRCAFLNAKRSSAPPASALIGCLGYFWEMPQ